MLLEACGPADADGAEDCRKLSAVADALGTGVSPTVGGDVASGTAIEDDPAAGSDGGRPVCSRLAGQIAPRGAEPGNLSVEHFVAAGSARRSGVESPVASPPLCIGRACIRKGRTQSNQATGMEKSALYISCSRDGMMIKGKQYLC